MKMNFEVMVSGGGLIRRPQTGAILRLSSSPWPEGLPTDWGPSSELLPFSASWPDRNSIWWGAGQGVGFGVGHGHGRLRLGLGWVWLWVGCGRVSDSVWCEWVWWMGVVVTPGPSGVGMCGGWVRLWLRGSSYFHCWRPVRCSMYMSRDQRMVSLTHNFRNSLA